MVPLNSGRKSHDPWHRYLLPPNWLVSKGVAMGFFSFLFFRFFSLVRFPSVKARLSKNNGWTDLCRGLSGHLETNAKKDEWEVEAFLKNGPGKAMSMKDE